MMTIKILLADDHNLIREGLRTLISDEPNMSVIAEAEEGRTAVQLAAKLSPNVVIMDISMPGLNGIEATRQILAKSPEPKIIALSMHMERRMILEMLNAGASGYLLKDCVFGEMIRHRDRHVQLHLSQPEDRRYHRKGLYPPDPL
jgi:DNA-binding NarL/FixJ family response regulator